MRTISKIIICLLIFLLISCTSRNNKLEKIDCIIYEPIIIPADTTDFETYYEEQKRIHYEETVDLIDVTCNINSACIKIGTEIERENISFVVVKEDDKIIFLKTRDFDFKTKSGLSIKDPVSKYLETYGTEFFVEPGTCIFLKLEDDWRACISMANNTIKLDESILYFYKVDSKYSNAMTLKEWNEYIIPLNF